jgi:hypothetical protein
MEEHHQPSAWRIPSPRRFARQVNRVATRARTLFDLTSELAQLEAKRKAAALGKAAAIGIAAGIFVFYAVGILLAAAAAALSLALPVWASLLIVGLALLLTAVILGLVAKKIAKGAGPPVPTEAIDEAKRTAEMVQNNV